MTHYLPLFLALLAIASCDSADREQAVFDLINQGKPEEALDVVPLSDCALYLDVCAKLGTGLLEYDEHVETAKQYISTAAAGGHPRAKVVLGNFLIAGAYYEKDVSAGLKLLQESVDIGTSEGMYYLANEYHSGVNIEKDDIAALELWKKATELGHIYAPFNAGVVHWDLYQDCKTTERYFELGAPYMEDALNALEELRTQGPCAPPFKEGQYLAEWQFDDVVRLQVSGSNQNLDELYEYGVPEDAEFLVKYSFNTNDENKARSLSSALIAMGYSSEYSHAPASDTMHVVTGWTLPISMSRDSVVDWTESMCRIGFEHDAEFTGWGTNPEQLEMN